MNLKIKEVIAKILKWMSIQGASATGRIVYGAVTTVTPTRSGWLVVLLKTETPSPTFAPIASIYQNGETMASATGVTYQESAYSCSCYVRKGETYTIGCFRSSIQGVYLY